MAKFISPEKQKEIKDKLKKQYNRLVKKIYNLPETETGDKNNG